jgi:hypothetical protein
MKLSSTCEPIRSWPVSPLLLNRMNWDGSVRGSVGGSVWRWLAEISAIGDNN